MTDTIHRLIDNISSVIVGKDETVRLLTATLLARGHLLIEDAPGLGKTILARALARSVNGRFRRVQCTPDLLPSDITGVSVYNEKTNEFEFKPGPVFTNVLLVDEINRTTPRTQSSLLEAMGETQVSADGKTYALKPPFFVIATQNPVEYHGTYPLPEAQLDRFFMKVSMGYPHIDEEVRIMQMQRAAHPIDSLNAVINVDEVLKLQDAVTDVEIQENVLRYIASLIQATREHRELSYGASPRGSLALMRAAQAMALIEGERYVSPQLVKRVAIPVLAHRIVVKPQFSTDTGTQQIMAEILSKVPVPIA